VATELAILAAGWFSSSPRSLRALFGGVARELPVGDCMAPTGMLVYLLLAVP
jgi:hypothetical protein